MKAKLFEFDTSTHEGQMEFKRHAKALDMAITLFDIAYNLRGQIERDIEKCEESEIELKTYDIVDMVCYRIDSILEDNNIEISELVD